MQRPKSPRPKSARLLDREIAEVLTLPWQGARIPIDPSPRTVKPFELDRPYVIKHRGRLYTIVLDTKRGRVAHPATIEGRTPTRAGATKKHLGHAAHATKAKTHDKTSDKITIDQLAKTFGLPDWEKIDEMNQQHYWEMSRGAGAEHLADDEEAQLAAESAAQDEVYGQWYDAIEHVASKLFEEHGLELQPTGKQGTEKRRYDFKIVPSNSWNDAANKIRETINGVGDFHFDTLRELLDSGPYTARQAVLSHLGYIRRYPAVYGGLGAHQMYEQAWR